MDNYLELADWLNRHEQFDEAEQLLVTADQVAGGGNHEVRHRIEETQLKRIQRKMAVADQRAEREKSEENVRLARKIRVEANQIELEIYAARAQRRPDRPSLQFELALRLKRAGKYREAVQAFQAARGDAPRKALVFLELGECFQKIEQFKLAMTNYESAIDASDEPSPSEVLKLALYRAGVLSTGLRELERAEQYLTRLAGIDFGYRDVAARLDKINRLRHSN